MTILERTHIFILRKKVASKEELEEFAEDEFIDYDEDNPGRYTLTGTKGKIMCSIVLNNDYEETLGD